MAEETASSCGHAEETASPCGHAEETAGPCVHTEENSHVTYLVNLDRGDFCTVTERAMEIHFLAEQKH